MNVKSREISLQEEGALPIVQLSISFRLNSKKVIVVSIGGFSLKFFVFTLSRKVPQYSAIFI